jgi:hypothetical protein
MYVYGRAECCIFNKIWDGNIIKVSQTLRETGYKNENCIDQADDI